MRKKLFKLAKIGGHQDKKSLNLNDLKKKRTVHEGLH